MYKHFIYAYIDIDTSLNIPISKHRSAYYVCICACMHACMFVSVLVFCGMLWYVWYAMVCYGVLWYEMLWNDYACYVWFAMVCYGMLYHGMLRYVLLCDVTVCYVCVLLCYVMFCYALLPCFAMPCFSMLCCAVPCRAMLFYAMFCYAMLCYVCLYVCLYARMNVCAYVHMYASNLQVASEETSCRRIPHLDPSQIPLPNSFLHCAIAPFAPCLAVSAMSWSSSPLPLATLTVVTSTVPLLARPEAVHHVEVACCFLLGVYVIF